MTSSESPFSESSVAKPSAPHKESYSESYQQFLSHVETLPTPEEKIAYGLQFMRESISQEGAPRFRDFWEARRNLLQFFKNNLNAAIRSKLWDEYVELTVEARRLKEIFEEESAFAMEQIDLAVKALENDLENIDALVDQVEPFFFPQEVRSIASKLERYQEIQGELNFFNTLASRLSSLRKEVIRTEMRVRYKTKFFKRLSELGDRIFPQRKSLIEQISKEFDADVSLFISKHFHGDEVVGAPYYALREEIKAFQGLAKLLTLNTAVFAQTRLQLSECWDKIKVLEKAHKQEFQQKKQEWAENREAIEKKIEELKAQSETMDFGEVNRSLSEIQNEMFSSALSKEDVRQLKEKMYEVRLPFLQKEEENRREAQRQEEERLRLKKERVLALKEQISSMKDSDATAEDLQKEIENIKQEVDSLSLGKFEQQQFDRLLKPIKDLIAERRESALLNLSDDDLNLLTQFREVLVQRRQRRQEIKDQIETYRKMLASSGLDFEKAMLYREQMDEEKERLEKINISISEVEQKILQIEEKA